jgi:leucyl/phenylalanyl-tRNA---protein transferase
MLYAIQNNDPFPPVHLSQSDGLLAVGGSLTRQRLLDAYKRGIFPWYEGKYPMWWCPDPRFVLFPEELVISKSMKQLLKRKVFEFRYNTAFAEVISNCKQVKRKLQESTWITDEVEQAYNDLNEAGIAVSAEVWQDGNLVGGLYGIRMGKVFFGESMFSKVSNASKYAFICYVDQLKKEGVELIDCQVYTEHLESLGARMLSRNDFTARLKQLI